MASKVVIGYTYFNKRIPSWLTGTINAEFESKVYAHHVPELEVLMKKRHYPNNSFKITSVTCDGEVIFNKPVMTFV